MVALTGPIAPARLALLSRRRRRRRARAVGAWARFGGGVVLSVLTALLIVQLVGGLLG